MSEEEKQAKIEKHNRMFKKYRTICIILSVIFTYLIYSFATGWIKADGGDPVFTSDGVIVIVVCLLGSFATLYMYGFVVHRFIIWLIKRK